MHRHPWRIVRALRVLIACLVLMLPAAPARAAQFVPDTVFVVAYTAAASRAFAAAREVPPANVEVPAQSFVEAAPAERALARSSPFTAAPGFFVEDRWLLHCALLC